MDKARPPVPPPALSVVAIIRHPKDRPDDLLAALGRQPGIARVPVLLVDGREAAPDDDLTAGRPWLQHLRAPGKSMPELKALGAERALAEAIAFLEPRALPGPGWLAAVSDALAAHPGAALGGGVDFAGTPTPAGQAAFAFEYGAFTADKIARGMVHDLSANNMILPRAALWELCGDILRREGLNKPFCQKRLSDGGVPIILLNGFAVALHSDHRLWPLLKSRYFYARCFGGTRAALAPARQRWLYRLGAPAVPFLLFRRHARTLRGLDIGGKSLASYLALAALCLAWGAGEAAGSWFGPGKACTRLY